MRTITSIAEWRRVRAELPASPRGIGFVPTMGNLHAGHRALLERARVESDVTVLSIFVNPTQFNDPRDLAVYPRTLPEDLALAAGLADYVFAPTPAEIYPDEYRFRVTETKLAQELEGAHRPGHFDGVLTVVLRLLHLVQPRRAYFGEKDWQQLQLVKDMTAAFCLPVEIVACATVREANGLALSSRNARLSAGARAAAGAFSEILRTSPDAATAAQRLTAAGFGVDYVDDRAGVRLGAIRIEGTRLIDNVPL